MAGQKEDTSDDGRFARGMSGPFGKFDYGRVKTELDEETFNAWLRLCASKDVTSSEMLRDLIYLIVHRKTPAELVANDRRGLLDLEGSTQVLNRAGARA